MIDPKLLYKLFPVYLIDTRFISLQDWTSLWDIISDISLGQIQIDDETVEKNIDNFLEEVYGEKYTKSLNMIKKIFETEGIRIADASYKDKYRNALIMRLGGNDFLSEENKLSYYSDGLNSLKYIKLVIGLVSELSNTGWKNPLLLMDEPEIGLHSQYIEELVRCIEKNRNYRVNILISTHSPHLVSEMIKNRMTLCNWRVYNQYGYAYFEKLKDILDDKQKYLVGDTESSCYFSNALLFVEGKSEIQLFKNPRIKQLYSEIDKVNIVNYDSDNSSLRLIYPDEAGFSIPYFIVIDMDKILTYSYKTNKFKIKPDSFVNPLYNLKVIKNQKFYYFNNDNLKKNTYNLGLYIKKMLKTGIFVQSENDIYIKDIFFNKLIKYIEIYCYNYRVIPIKTTIEGAIINVDNIEIVIEWLMIKFDISHQRKLNEILSKEDIDNKLYRATVVRCILNGKLDNLKNINESGVKIEKELKKKILCLRKECGKKASGWIAEFMEFYFIDNIDILETIEEKRRVFMNDFREIDNVLKSTINML